MERAVNDIEQFVRRATRGLPRAARRAAQAELRGHLTERRLELRAGGLTEREATRQALRELGEADELNAQYARVHTLPVITRGVAALALFAALAVSALPPVRSDTTTASAFTDGFPFLARPYVHGTARPVPIPRCFDARLVLLGPHPDGATLHEGQYRCLDRTARPTPRAR